METVFDHNITNEEAKRLSVSNNEFIYKNGLTERNAYTDLAELFRIRKDKNLFLKYSELANRQMEFTDETMS